MLLQHEENKDQLETKQVLQCTHKGITNIVNWFNHIVSEMEGLCNGGEAPHSAQIPAQLDIKKLFQLDIDNQIWIDGGLRGLDEGSLHDG